MKHFIIIILLLSLSNIATAVGQNGIYQYSVEVSGYISGETGKTPQAYLWIPEDCNQVKAVVFAQQNMTEEMIFRSLDFRKKMQNLGVALLWVAPAFSNSWDVATGCQQIFDEMLVAIAFQSGHPEIQNAPIIPLGHSAQATMPWNFAAWNANRTLCIVSFHGDAPRTNLCGYGTANIEWGRTRNIDGIPGLMIIGEYEWWDARVRPALAFRMMYPNSCISLLCDTGSGHFECMPETTDYIARFIETSLCLRLSEDGNMLKLKPEDGWLAQGWNQDEDNPRAEPSPYVSYRGDPHEAFWYANRDMAMTAEKRYAHSRGKRKQHVGFEVDGNLIPFNGSIQGGMEVAFVPSAKDSLTMYIKAVHTDSTHIHPSSSNAKRKPRFEVISGPAYKSGENTLRLQPYEAGWDNPRRSFTVWVVAIAEGDEIYKRAVQPMRIDIPASIRHLIK